MNSFCIIGLGKFGYTLAETLINNNKQVLVIDSNPDKVNAISDIATHAVIGDPTNEAVLKASGVENYECAIIGIAGNINDNILLTIMLKDLGIKKVVARATNEGHYKVLQRIGADIIVFPEKDMGEKLAQLLSKDKITEFIEFHGYQIVEIDVPKNWIGKTLLDLDIRKKYNITVLAISGTDGTLSVSPSPQKEFRGQDKVSLLGTEKDIEKLIKQI